jgi:hypothetical protein
VEKSTVDYLDALEEELREVEGYVPACPTTVEKKELKSTTDADCGYIHQDTKKGFGYLAEMTVDVANGIITGVDCYPANRRESDIILKHLWRQIQDNNPMKKGFAYQPEADILNAGKGNPFHFQNLYSRRERAITACCHRSRFMQELH